MPWWRQLHPAPQILVTRVAVDALQPGVCVEVNSSGTEPSAVNQIPPPRPPARPPSQTVSACENHRAWIESQVELGRNAQRIYQDLVEAHGFAHRYNSVTGPVLSSAAAGASAAR